MVVVESLTSISLSTIGSSVTSSLHWCCIRATSCTVTPTPITSTPVWCGVTPSPLTVAGPCLHEMMTLWVHRPDITAILLCIISTLLYGTCLHLERSLTDLTHQAQADP